MEHPVNCKPPYLTCDRMRMMDSRVNPSARSVSFTCLGAPVSLKNTKRIGRGRVYNSQEYQSWAASFGLQVPPDARGLMLGGEQPSGEIVLLRATVSVFYADWRPDVDIEGVWDVLQAMRVVSNDRWIRIKHIDGSQVDAANPRIHLLIEEI